MAWDWHNLAACTVQPTRGCGVAVRRACTLGTDPPRLREEETPSGLGKCPTEESVRRTRVCCKEAPEQAVRVGIGSGRGGRGPSRAIILIGPWYYLVRFRTGAIAV